MIKNVFLRIFVSLPLMVAGINAQDGVDAIEKARQAKEAADKAAAEAAAATEAAIEAAAAKAAKAAREEAKKKKEEDEARKIAEAKAAEEAELDAAASAAAEEAKRRMAAELGLEVNEVDDNTIAEETTTAATEEAQDVVAKEARSFGIGAAASVGLLSGGTFTNVPTGGTVVITTPFGFNLGPFDYTVSIGFGGYSGSNDENPDAVLTFDPQFVGIGGNLTLAEFIFAEGHIGTVGEGTGFRGFAGVTLERLMNSALNLPFNILIGSEAFYSTDMAGIGNASGWASLGVRLDYSF